MFPERLECLRVSKEIGDADQEVAKERVHVGRVLTQIAGILFQQFDLVDGHAPLHAADKCASLVLRKIVTGLGAQQDEDLFQPAFGFGDRKNGRDGRFSESARDVGDELGWHPGRRQHVVHQASGNGVARHAVVFSGCGFLRHRHAPFALDGTQPFGAVTACPGEHDADGALALILGQGTKEKVNRVTLASGCGGFQQLQCAACKSHVLVGRDNVGAVGLDHHAVDNLENLHAGIAPDQLREHAFVIRGKMLHQNKGHARISVGGHAGKEGFKCSQPSGGRADANHGEHGQGSIRRGWRLSRFRFHGFVFNGLVLLRCPVLCRHDASPASVPQIGGPCHDLESGRGVRHESDRLVGMLAN